jgi:hypothetical protein
MERRLLTLGVSQYPSLRFDDVTVESVRLRLLLVAPLRFVLGGALFATARAVGAAGGPAYLAFAGGLVAMVFLLSQDPRASFQRSADPPTPLPDQAEVAPAWLHAVHAAFPSTVGVSVLGAISLGFEPVAAALLAGLLVGLGVTAALRAYLIDPGLYFDPGSDSLFRR